MADDDLRDVQDRLRKYVFDELLRSQDSPAAQDLRRAIHDALRVELDSIRTELRGQIAEIKREVEAINKSKVDNGTLREIAARLGVLAKTGGNDRINIVAGGPRKGAIGAVEAGALAVFLVGAVFVAWMFMSGQWPSTTAGQQAGGNVAAIEDAAPLVGGDSPEELETAGWERLLTNAELRQRICGEADPCDRATLDPQPQDRALQAAMNLVRAKFECEGAAIAEDGDLQETGAAAVANTVRCVENAQRESHSACNDGACISPRSPLDLTVERKSDWRLPLLNWALRLIARE
jgi:hypothetical protein